MRIAAIVLLWGVTIIACASDFEGALVCNSATSYFAMGDLGKTQDLQGAERINFEFPPLRISRGISPGGDHYRLPSYEVRKIRCGRFTLLLRSKYLNNNPSGLDGVFQFGTVEVRENSRLLLAETAIFDWCEQTHSFDERFGRCPDRYAGLLTVSPEGRFGGIKVRMWRTFANRNAETINRIDETWLKPRSKIRRKHS